jgi:DNA-binding NtrC family response regulator
MPSRTVLVIDDLVEILRFFEALGQRLEPQGVRIVTESDPRRALERVRAEDYALVISDYRMREVDGLDVLKAARAARPEALRILMTGYNEINAPIARIREAQVDAYVQKPLRAQELSLLILDFLNRNEGTLRAFRKQARDLETMGAHEEAKA